ncbi:GGDEF domain-containing protein [Bradyrhizobium sp. SSBR45G]|uniref:GGDEF domain-containing protein n=1 Tax=unclassified Bradyrhizobium TaxID=2631580 RepID=UPI002342B8D2|nr:MULTISPECIES: GGDEF domain-containing protein [unclassified Bradyrhizobium]GLH80355.1 GGDEF domain-containing protein [Bradyrhizobium sp. SSBR45G]GLH87849.1 GGDEF domain-containing protein [Bradyrhizobium sp. SSBR45R]
MLNVPTLWTAFVVNFLALGLIWAYVMRSYPNLESARFWTASALMCPPAALCALAHFYFGSFAPLLAAASVMTSAICLAAMGVERFYGRKASWRLSAAVVGLTCASIAFFVYVYDNGALRILCYSLGQAVPMAVIARLVLDPRHGAINPGARLAGVLSILIIAVFAVRTAGAFIGADVSFGRSSSGQAAAVLLLIFLSMSLNFGFLLMAVDRLRNEVADLALLDDLTGVANRRHLMQRLTEECARAERSGRPFALLVIDLDGFKLINDNHGHAAGDACLQHFTLMAQTRLRPGDMLARTGGDEFCIVLPSSGMSEGAMIARRILQVCRDDAEACAGNDVPIEVSIGVAEWTHDVAAFPDRLMARADQALYAAKRDGKNGFAVYQGDLDAPALAPDSIEAMLAPQPRQDAAAE